METSQWPERLPDRREWLARVVSDRLAAVDPLRSVRWLSESQVSLPRRLRLLVDLSGYYGLPVDDDVLLVQALLGVHTNSMAEYHRKRPLSPAAISELDRLLADPVLPVGAVSHFLSFLASTGIYSPTIEQSLERLVLQASATGNSAGTMVIDGNRRAAANILTTRSPDQLIVGLSKQVKGTMVID
jgi:hypothetical protein